MTKLAYLECPTGLAGDMCLGALVHAGVPLDYLLEKLSLLGIGDEYQLWAEFVHRNGQQATKVHVEQATAPLQPLAPHAVVRPLDPSKSQHTHSHSDAEQAHPAHPPTHTEHRHDHGQHDHGQHDHDPHDHRPHNHDPHDHHSHDHHSHDRGTRHLPEIELLITSAGLPDRAEAWSLAVFRQLAAAEAAVHGIAADQVHFHEVGATDAIVDIVGTCLGLDWLEIDQLYCSALPVGGGTVRAAHGLLPVPAPAVLKLLEMGQVSLYSNGIYRELVTPTGAAIVTTLATQFGPPPAMTLQRVGLGAGSQDLVIPNILRLWIGEGEEGRQRAGRGQKAEIRNEFVFTSPSTHPPIHPSTHPPTQFSLLTPHSSLETIAVLETQIDDLNPQAIGYLFEVLFAAGALDVWTQAIGMKKSRPGMLLTVICHREQADTCESVIFRETTTLGVRRSQQQRTVLQREIQTVQTIYGTVRVKVARRESTAAITDGQPEYEDCAALARQAHVPWQAVHRLALHEWYSKRTEERGLRRED